MGQTTWCAKWPLVQLARHAHAHSVLLMAILICTMSAYCSPELINPVKNPTQSLSSLLSSFYISTGKYTTTHLGTTV